MKSDTLYNRHRCSGYGNQELRTKKGDEEEEEEKEDDAFQNTPSSITTEIVLIWPDSPPSNTKALVRKPNFVQAFASLKPSFQIAVLLGFCKLLFSFF